MTIFLMYAKSRPSQQDRIYPMHGMERRRHSKRCFVKLLSILSIFTSTHAEVILSATDGVVSVPGGYIVPQNGTLTLKCHATTFPNITSLQWNITLNSRTSVIGSSGTLISRSQGKYSVPDGLQTENPTLLNIHNLQLHENGSTVQCVVPNLHGVYVARSPTQDIFVEMAPLCPKVNVTNTVNCIIAWSPDDHVLLPTSYTVSVGTMNGKTILLQNTSQSRFKLTEKGISALTNYSVMVTACTSAGCSQNCDHTWFSVPLKVSKPGTDTPGTDPSSVTVHPSRQLGFPIIPVIIAVGVLVAILGVVVALGIAFLVCIACWKWKRRCNYPNKHRTVVELSNSEGEEEGRYQEPQYAVVADAIPNRTHPDTDRCATTSESTHTVMEGYSEIRNQSKTGNKVRIRTISASNFESKGGSSPNNVSNLVTDHQTTSPVSVQNGSGDPTHSHHSLNSSSQLELSEDNGFTSQYAMLSPVTQDEL